MNKKILNPIVFIVLFATILFGCSSEDSFESIDFDNLQFVVNVSTGSDTSKHNIKSKVNSKSQWTNLDCIYISVDHSASNIYKLTYNGEDWSVEKVLESARFSNTTGKINAVYSEKSAMGQSDEVDIQGDILYTDEGTYTIEDNIVYINLKMNKRPIVRIEVKGIDSGFYIDELENYSKVKLSNLSWIKNTEQYTGQKEDGSIVYYGAMPESNDDNYTFTLKNSNGYEYTRTYTGKILSNGDYIILNGPNTEEKDNWTLKLTGIKAVKENLILPINSSGKVTELYQLIPKEATNNDVEVISSNSSVVKVNENGTFTTVDVGQSDIIVKTKDGNFECKTTIEVKDVKDLVKIKLTSHSYSGIIIGGYSQFTHYYQYSVSNSSDRTALLIEAWTDPNNKKTLDVTIQAQSTVEAFTLTTQSSTEPTVYAKVKFGNDEYQIQTQAE